MTTLDKVGSNNVSTHSRPKAAGKTCHQIWIRQFCFNTQPPEGGWEVDVQMKMKYLSFNTQPPEGGWINATARFAISGCFNTQPPEGGWQREEEKSLKELLFQHTAARRRLDNRTKNWQPLKLFQHTAARRRLAKRLLVATFASLVSTHSRPKAAGFHPHFHILLFTVSTHSRPKAAGHIYQKMTTSLVSTHSRPKAAGTATHGASEA